VVKTTNDDEVESIIRKDFWKGFWDCGGYTRELGDGLYKMQKLY